MVAPNDCLPYTTVPLVEPSVINGRSRLIMVAVSLTDSSSRLRRGSKVWWGDSSVVLVEQLPFTMFTLKVRGSIPAQTNGKKKSRFMCHNAPTSPLCKVGRYKAGTGKANRIRVGKKLAFTHIGRAGGYNH